MPYQAAGKGGDAAHHIADNAPIPETRIEASIGAVTRQGESRNATAIGETGRDQIAVRLHDQRKDPVIAAEIGDRSPQDTEFRIQAPIRVVTREGEVFTTVDKRDAGRDQLAVRLPDHVKGPVEAAEVGEHAPVAVEAGVEVPGGGENRGGQAERDE